MMAEVHGGVRASPGELSVCSWPLSTPRRVKSGGSMSDIVRGPQGPIYRRQQTTIRYDVHKERCSRTHVLERTGSVGNNTTNLGTPESRFAMADEDCLCNKVFHMRDAIAIVPPTGTPRTRATARWFTPASVRTACTDCRHPDRLSTGRATMCRGDKYIMGRLWDLNTYLDNAGDFHRPSSGPPAHPWFKTRLCAVHDLPTPTPTTPHLPALPNRTDRFEQMVRREARANARQQLPLRTVTLLWRNMRSREAYNQQELHHFVSMIGAVDSIMLLGPTSARVVFKDMDAACKAVNATGKFGRPDNRLYCNWLHRGMDNKRFRLKGRQLVVQYDPTLYT